ncbi:Holliday junction resolvase RecU [Oceanimonas pelagia]|uniref:Holliday junction resolvase RecU n=1 Tax=Oceanimonas pelagia TaxID=3028314 RepID=A0AA50KMD5_9GAMM|nr:Holliday junction resolvase RecU [Oceanimonas pelagia]WMC09572.1 Holliday junction resolvase RecU [Oceanimonas pelagia]
MTTANRGKPEEQEIEAFFDLMGKDADLYRFEDYAEANFKGPTKTRKIVSAKPSDYLLTWKGQMCYLEVKASADPKRFSLKNIRTHQWLRAKRCTMAGGLYVFWVKSTAHGRWFEIPAEELLKAREEGKASVTWDELKEHDSTEYMEELRQYALADKAK